MEINSSNKLQGLKNSGWLVAGLLTSSILTACGGGGGPSAEELAAQAAAAQAAAAQAAAAQAAAAQAAAEQAAAAQAAAAQAAADKAAAITAARQVISDAVIAAGKETQSAQTASSTAQSVAKQAEQQASSYPEAATSLATTKEAALQASQAANSAAEQKAIAESAETNAQDSQDLAVIQAAAQKAKSAADSAKTARLAAEKALQSTQTAAQKVAADVAAAQATRRYTKLDANGNALPMTATSWSCVKDNNTGLVWEEKTNDGGLRDKNWRYRHLHNSGGYAGTVDYNGKVMCKGLGFCDPYTYISAVQGQALCGRTSWRLPVKSEFGTIAKINSGGVPPHIDQSVFPDVVNKPYEAAYCTENMIRDPAECGYAAGTEVHYNSDGRIECNYQGVDFGLPLQNGIQTQSNLEMSILVPLRFYGEVQDGKPLWPSANWICYTRLVSSR